MGCKSEQKNKIANAKWKLGATEECDAFSMPLLIRIETLSRVCHEKSSHYYEEPVFQYNGYEALNWKEWLLGLCLARRTL